MWQVWGRDIRVGFLWSNLKKKRWLGRPRCGSEDNTKMDLKRTRTGRWHVVSSCDHGNEPSSSIKCDRNNLAAEKLFMHTAIWSFLRRFYRDRYGTGVASRTCIHNVTGVICVTRTRIKTRHRLISHRFTNVLAASSSRVHKFMFPTFRKIFL